MGQDPRTQNETTPEGRIAVQAAAITRRIAQMSRASVNRVIVADVADYRDGLRLYVQLELMSARRDEAQQSHEKLAIDKGRKLYLFNRALELQEKIDAIVAEIAKLET